jgi:hypothetical protein
MYIIHNHGLPEGLIAQNEARFNWIQYMLPDFQRESAASV